MPIPEAHFHNYIFYGLVSNLVPTLLVAIRSRAVIRAVYRSYLRRHSALSRASSRHTVHRHTALNSSKTMGSLRRCDDNSHSKVQNVRMDSSAALLPLRQLFR
jgi:hypothetical protein